MNKWLKAIGVFAAAMIALEVVAYVGLMLLGPTAFSDMIDILNPTGEPTTVVAMTTPSGGEKKCSTYRGEIFCITDGEEVTASGFESRGDQVMPASAVATNRCADFEGQTICIKEDN